MSSMSDPVPRKYQRVADVCPQSCGSMVVSLLRGAAGHVEGSGLRHSVEKYIWDTNNGDPSNNLTGFCGNFKSHCAGNCLRSH